MESRKRSASESLGDSQDSKKGKDAKELYNTLAGHGCLKGERAEMQDTYIMIPKFDLGADKSFLSRSSFFAIFDGHAGPRASEYCQSHMAEAVKENLTQFTDLATMTKSLKQAFTESYKTVDDGFTVIARPSCMKSKPVWKDGTTATTMIILNNAIYVANIGDSKAVVARKKEDGTLSAICLTVDHNPMDHDERMRIQKTGAVVNSRDGRINGFIEVSRSIGDLPFKSLGIICTPDIKKLTLSGNDQFAIIACDGLWKVFSNIEAVQYAAEQLESVKKMEIEQEPNESREVAELRVVAEKLAAEAVRRKCGDNVSVIIVKLDIIFP